jgi:hypothetical protein
VPLNDPGIRQALWRHLSTTLDVSKPTVVINELPLQCGSAIVDVAVINGEMVGYEIKSDVDSLRRLASQVDMFGEVFDRLFAVTTVARLKALRAAVPAWWGLLVVNELGEVRQVRSAKENRGRITEVVLDILTRSELAGIARENRLRGYGSDLKNDLCRRLRVALGDDEARHAVRNRLRERRDWTSRQRGGDSELHFA